jgi:rhodanese-related sulfurtransferase
MSKKMSDNAVKMSMLAKTWIFTTLPEEQLAEIASVLKSEVIPAKKLLFRKGNPGDSFYIVHSGKLRVFLKGEDDIETDLNWLESGDSFGEMALLTSEPRSACVETLEETHLFILNKQDFDQVLQKYPEIYKNCIKHVTGLLKRDEQRIQAESEREYRTTRLTLFDFIFIGVVIIIFAAIFNLSNPNRINVLPDLYDPKEIPKISMEEAKKKFDKGETIFVDARPSQFYNKSHIKGAHNLPLPSFEINYMYMSEEDKDKDIIVYGRSIGALYDEAVARQLELFGHENLKILKGGKQFMPLRWFALDTWKESGFPVEGAGHE